MKKKHTILFGWILFAAMGITSCNSTEPVSDLTKHALIPKPISVRADGGTFELNKASSIYVDNGSAELSGIGKYLADKLRPSMGFELTVAEGKGDSASGNHIYLSVTANDPSLGEEGYHLGITGHAIRLTANQAAGVFRGLQTVFQLLPDKIALQSKQAGPWKIPTGTISDHPSYNFRSSMLDVSWHFFGVEDVKRYIDLGFG